MQGHMTKNDLSEMCVAFVFFANMIFIMKHIVKIDATEIEFKHIVKTWYWYLCMGHVCNIDSSEVWVW